MAALGKRVPNFLLQPDNVLRPVDWRWQAVTGGVRAVRARKDVYMHVMRRFHETKTAARGVDDENRLYESYPSLSEALFLHQTEDHESVRHELEARVLSRQTSEEIKTAMRLPLETVRWYELAFFDIRDRLDVTSAVYSQVFVASINGALSNNDYGSLWKLCAYHGGVQVLEAVLCKLDTAPVRVGGKPDDFFSDQFRKVANRQRLAALLTMRAQDAFSKVQFVETVNRLENEDRDRSGGSGVGESALVTAAEEFLRGIQMEVTKPSFRRVDGQIDDSPKREPRAAEMLLLASGEYVPEVRTAGFPPPPAKKKKK